MKGKKALFGLEDNYTGIVISSSTAAMTRSGLLERNVC